MFIQKRLITLLEILNKYDRKIPCSELSKLIGVSERTIRTDIGNLNTTLAEHGASIKIKRNEGYYIFISNLNKFQQYLAENSKEVMDANKLPNTPIERTKYIIKYLLYKNDYIKLEDLADKLFISKITILNDIKRIKPILSNYNLIIKSKPYYGIKIYGKELDIRKCISENIINRNFEDYILGITNEEIEIFKEIDLKLIQEIVLKKISNSSVEFSDFSFKNFIIHLAIAISRIKNNCIVEENLEVLDLEFDDIITPIINSIFEDIENKIKIIFPNSEKIYIADHFKSKSTTKSIDNDNTNDIISIYTKNLLEYIYTHYNFDLREDSILFHDLILHFKSILNSKYYNINRSNPLINTIKSNYPLAFEVTLTAINNVFKNTIYNFTEDEIGYVSLHIGAAIERYFNNNIQSKKVTIVCGSGYGTSRLLEAKLNKVFRDKIEILECLSYNQYLSKDVSRSDFIISTIPIENKTTPVILVDFSLLQNDVEVVSKAITDEPIIFNKVLSEYFDKRLFLKSPKVYNKNDLLNLMCENLNKNEIIFPSYRDSLFYRESISPTNIDDFLAIPHPMELGAINTKISVAILSEPIIWNKDISVKVIFMIAINKNDYFEMNKVYDIFLKIIGSEKIKEDILNCTNYEDFLKLLQSIL